MMSGMATPDDAVTNHIEQLVQEEHELYRQGDGGRGLDDDQHARLEAIRIELDRYYQLLRARRAHRDNAS